MSHDRIRIGGPVLADLISNNVPDTLSPEMAADATSVLVRTIEGKEVLALREWTEWEPLAGQEDIEIRVRVDRFDPLTDGFHWYVDFRPASDRPIEILYRIGDPDDLDGLIECAARIEPGEIHRAWAVLGNGRDVSIAIDGLRVPEIAEPF